MAHHNPALKNQDMARLLPCDGIDTNLGRDAFHVSAPDPEAMYHSLLAALAAFRVPSPFVQNR